MTRGWSEPDPSRPIASRVRHLRYNLIVSAAVLVLGALTGLLATGPVGAIGVATGVGLVIASYVASTLAIAWADSVNPRMVMSVGLTVYILKFSLFGAMLIYIESVNWAGAIPMAMGIVAGVIAWTATQIWWTVRVTRTL